jgi:hypothetical protein
MSRFPQAPRRARVIRCFSDCEAQYTENPSDCTCAERDEALYEAECDRRMDAWRNGD